MHSYKTNKQENIKGTNRATKLHTVIVGKKLSVQISPTPAKYREIMYGNSRKIPNFKFDFGRLSPVKTMGASTFLKSELTIVLNFHAKIITILIPVSQAGVGVPARDIVLCSRERHFVCTTFY